MAFGLAYSWVLLSLRYSSFLPLVFVTKVFPLSLSLCGVCLLYIIFAKLVVHIRFKREYNQFMQDLRQMLKEEPIHSSSQWKLLLYN